MSRLIIFDTSGVIHRAFHAMPRFTRAGDGKSVGAIGGFWQIIYRTLKTHLRAEPDDLVAFACDAPGPTFRHEIYPAYKGERAPKDPELSSQEPDIYGLMPVSGIEQLMISRFEADDILATVAHKRALRQQQTIIVSADKDMMQCMPYAALFGWVSEERINDRGQPYKLFVQRYITEEDCRAKFGCAPVHVATALALMGDSADNFPGVKGVGIRGATRLIESYGDLESILRAAASMDNARMKAALQEQADDARLCLEIATVRTDVPNLPGIWSTVGEIDWHAIASRLRRYGLVTAPEELERGIE